MKKFYISSIDGSGGVPQYAKLFYSCILRPLDYIFIDSNTDVVSILSKISSRDLVHIEIGIFQKKELNVLFAMLDANYQNISITLHDPPLLRYPFKEFKNSFLQLISKFYDKYLYGTNAAVPLFKKIKNIYVLSNKGVKIMKSRFGLTNVYFLPHIIDVNNIVQARNTGRNFLYFGYVGPNKGIEYALELHKYILNIYPETIFYVIGGAIGKQNTYFNNLKSRFSQNVHYLGYVSQDKLNSIFESAGFALLPFEDYKFYYPISGSILYCLQQGKIVLTKNVNAISEIIRDGVNGVILEGNLVNDFHKVDFLFSSITMIKSIQDQISPYLIDNHSAEVVAAYYRN